MANPGIVGERLFVAATLDPVEEGQRFARIPPHMTVVGWFSFPSEKQAVLWNAMDTIFTNKEVFQNLQGGKQLQFGEHHDIPVREILHAETNPYFAIHALVKRMGKFPEGHKFSDIFSPHVTDEPLRSVAEGETIKIPTVALFAAHSDMLDKVVKAAFPLGAPRG